MNIAGLDYSPISPGLVILELDDETLETKSINWCGITDVIKNQKLYPDNLFLSRLKDHQSYLDRNEFAKNVVTNALEKFDVKYVGLEDYNFGGKGKSFHIGEATGAVKSWIYFNGIKLRLYDIGYIKKFATGNAGSATDKNVIWDHFCEIGADVIKPDVTKLTPGKSPSADIVDAFYIAKILQTELKLRRGLIDLKDLQEHIIWVFNRTTNSQKENLLCRPFIQRGK